MQAKERLKITVVSPIYGGSFDMSYYTAAGFAMNGHDAKIMDNSKYYAEFRAAAGDTGAQSAFAARVMEEVCREILQDGPDVVFGLAQAPLSSAALSKIRSAGILTAFWFVEDFRTLTYWKNIYRDYDVFFVIQDGAFAAKINRCGGRAFFLPVAAQLPPGKIAKGDIYRSGISFAGAPYRNRVNIMTALKDEPISIYGEGWSEAGGEALKKMVKIGDRRVTAEELRAVYSMSAVNINLYSSSVCDGLEEHRDFINPRTFEIPSLSGFQLSDRRNSIEDYFKPGEEIELFGSVQELMDKARFFMDNPQAAAKIAKAGEKRVAMEHTYFHRMRAAVEILKTGRPYVQAMQA
jgi:spore maturation protein CgeB